jgi:hypothetical protein
MLPQLAQIGARNYADLQPLIMSSNHLATAV